MSTSSTSSLPLLMRMGCTDEVIHYRAAGNEGVCLESPSHGVQVVANFNPAIGDFLGLDDILETTQAHDNLSDIANYVTSQVTSAGTELFVDLTGHGLTGTPFALIEGVDTTVAQLVADGGILYVPDAIAEPVVFNTPFTFRPNGLETAVLGHIAPGTAPAQIYNFNPSLTDKLELKNILNYTNALPNLSNVANYITASVSNGNTTLYFDKTGSGHQGIAFATLEGVATSVSQLLAQNALLFDPSGVTMFANPGKTFVCRSEGMETVQLANIQAGQGATQVQGFSVGLADGLDVTNILNQAGIQADISSIGNYLSTVESGGNTQLWFNANGAGSGGTLEAVFQGTSFSINDLLSHSALVVSH